MVPANAMYFMSSLFKVSAWNIFDLDTASWQAKKDKSVSITQNLDEQLYILGYKSKYILANFNSINAFWMAYILKFGFLFCLKLSRLSYGNQSRYEELYAYMFKKVFF